MKRLICFFKGHDWYTLLAFKHPGFLVKSCNRCHRVVKTEIEADPRPTWYSR
jgi:hypothetical protein